MNDDAIIDFLNVINNEGIDLDDLDLTIEEIEDYDVDDFNAILDSIDPTDFLDDDEEED